MHAQIKNPFLAYIRGIYLLVRFGPKIDLALDICISKLTKELQKIKFT
jgi:hypothetical protein